MHTAHSSLPHDSLQVYERAVANLPPGTEKRYWQRYIYLWVKYALFEELEAGDLERTREVYRAALKLIPHHLFTFSKVGRRPLMSHRGRCREVQVSCPRAALKPIPRQLVSSLK